MDNQPLISVIVPVYKVEAFLDKCISSIVNQTYKNLEIILVDDGSPDRSGEICDQWSEKDSRIRVIHQPNSGSGAARNTALEAAQGELISFVDSDDYVAPDMLAHLYALMEQGADIVECDHVDTFDDFAVFDAQNQVRVYPVGEAMEQHIQDGIFRQLIWNKLYRREVIGNIRFPSDKSIDDEFFTYQVLGNAKTLIRSEKVCYAYRQQASSVMHSMNPQKRLQAVEAKVQRHAYILENFPELAGISLKNLWFTCIYQGQIAMRKENAEEANRILEYLKDVLSSHPAEKASASLKERIWLTMASANFSMTCRLRNFLKIGL